MYQAVKNNVIYPLFTRIGTFAGGILVTYGMTGEAADQVIAGVLALAMFGVDLIGSYVNRARERKG